MLAITPLSIPPRNSVVAQRVADVTGDALEEFDFYEEAPPPTIWHQLDEIEPIERNLLGRLVPQQAYVIILTLQNKGLQAISRKMRLHPREIFYLRRRAIVNLRRAMAEVA